MNIATYVEQSRSVARYHDKSPLANFTYPALGLAGEIGETIDKITTYLPKEFGRKSDVVKELGDVLWYATNIPADINLSFLDLTDILTQGIRADTFSELGTLLSYGNDARPATIRLPIYCGKVAEIAKKMIRDSDGVFPVAKMPIVKDSICQVITCLYEICDTWAVSMDDVAQGNIDKLFSRRDRGVLAGDGDNR